MNTPLPIMASDLRWRVLDAVQRDPVPPRAITRRRRTWIVGGGFSISVVLAVVKATVHATTSARSVVGTQPSWHVASAPDASMAGSSLGYVVNLDLVWLLVALLLTWAAVGRGRSMLGRPLAIRIAVAALTPIALVMTWLLVAGAWLPSVLPAAWLEAMDESPALSFHLGCAGMSLAYAMGPFLAFLLIRRNDPLCPRRSAAAIGAVAGAWGAVVHLPFCPCSSPLHMLLGHVIPTIALASLGLLMGNRMLGLVTTKA